VVEVARDPAMLVWLDGRTNVKAYPQENFARELMELFTLGLDNYTQKDVVAMAKAWTGYTLAAPGYRTQTYNATWHDSSANTLFGITRSWQGPDALNEILTGKKAVPSSRFIAAKLFSYLAYPIDADDPVVTPLAAAFRASGLDIMALVREIFLSDAFWSAEARYGLVRSPVEWMVAGMQALELTSAQLAPGNYLDRAGNALFAHQDVSGWKGGEAWLSTATAWVKASFASACRNKCYSTLMFGDFMTKPAAQCVDEATAKFGMTEVSDGTRAALLATWDRAKAEKLPWSIGINMAFLLLLSPEFQVA
jgi:uncharacterized protein (DUF1800 family)